MRFPAVISMLILSLLVACNIGVPHQPYKLSGIPKFDKDSAYSFIEKQVSYGPRVPGSAAHDSCALFLISKLKSYGLTVDTQRFSAIRYDSLPLSGINIFASLNPEKKRRILLFAHWDSRFMAERDTDSLMRHRPILGANDGGSGTAVLLELARVMSKHPPKIGVDFLFLDLEDQGPVETKALLDFYKYWGLGAKYWAIHKPPAYKPLWGLELDLVGAKKAKFSIEDYSLYYYGYLIKKIWEIGQTLGYDTLFVEYRSHGLFDDHVVINEYAHIRSVLIIENLPHKYFGSYWHTHQDNMQIIDSNVLGAVGQTVLTTIYNIR